MSLPNTRFRWLALASLALGLLLAPMLQATAQPALSGAATTMATKAITSPAGATNEQAPVKVPVEPGAAGKAEPSATGAPASLYWYDGDHRRPLRIDPSQIADFRAPETAGVGAGADMQGPAGKAGGPLRAADAVEKSQGALPASVSPVLRDADAPAGAVRALPGGVIVTLKQPPSGTDPQARDSAARAALEAAGARPLRALDPSLQTWLVESPAGLESLELANRLHESGHFESAAPNWWRPRTRK